ncbi:MAG: glycine C-acetyltransferase [bacterium]|uniref:2-amino-3-ketobutyrate coenzyme A ligase n=2 Tax=Bacteria candidate phyla TaxID=1783234 RepID=A0A117M754_UNCT6|nr:MAG: 2-amino-3-ketobutyrate coenzyme A ligase [candidate division TA06 bacterium 32_111]KUK88029.1 MAG: 2-amino-3-ketobutyrate coenzyme A ligase [candidate division TA06 bacterium 34_109]MDI6700833.1 glycine C-acetyltransferase [bacterium]HAF06957.1 glycine C-acetyltransferase [candidate division WOR-3 bacterium]HCP16871.1 glycine C-acetyltransferase [candidate division WOR-3 bacterium]
MYGKIKDDLKKELEKIRSDNLYKDERVITSRQGVEITLNDGRKVLNFCANNYLGLAGTDRLVEIAKKGIEKYGYGLSSVRFICGTFDIHKKLEDKISEFLKKDDTILYAACFDANGGVFEPLLNEQDAIISDKLNHASIIDGVRLCKAQRFVYDHSNMEQLEEILKSTQNLRYRMIATDGVFSMDGDIAKLDKIVELAEKYDALVMVDDSHATGFIGKTGRGTIELMNVMDRVDIVTSTLGKALGGAMGGFISGRKEIIELLRQRSRPYLFSNSLSPVIVYTAYEIFNMLSETTELRDKLEENTKYFRERMEKSGFDIKPGIHPIVPIMFSKFENDAQLSQLFAKDLLDENIYVIGFYYPVVPKGSSRIRVQISAAHTKEHLDRAIEAFIKVGKKYNVI